MTKLQKNHNYTTGKCEMAENSISGSTGSNVVNKSTYKYHTIILKA